MTPLVYAAEDGDVNTVKWHMQNGSNPNQTKVSIVLSKENLELVAPSHTRMTTLKGVAHVHIL